MTGGDWGQYMMAVACGSWINCIAHILMIVLEVCSVLLLESPQKYPYSWIQFNCMNFDQIPDWHLVCTSSEWHHSLSLKKAFYYDFLLAFRERISPKVHDLINWNKSFTWTDQIVELMDCFWNWPLHIWSKISRSFLWHLESEAGLVCQLYFLPEIREPVPSW